MARIAVMSDTHLEHETFRWAHCTACGSTLSSRHAREGARCHCGRSAIKVQGTMRRLVGPAEWLPPPTPGWGFEVGRASVDLVVLAGDIHRGAEGIAWAAQEFEGIPTVYVAGNHEFYGGELHSGLEDLRAAAAKTSNVAFLERSARTFQLDGRPVRVLGATLWTDYELNAPPDFNAVQRLRAVDEAMMTAEEKLNDHRLIEIRESLVRRPFRGRDALALHQTTVDWLDDELRRSGSDDAVIIATHHAPARGSDLPPHQASGLSPAFVSDLEDLVREHEPVLWVHGHTHTSCDYMVGATRVLSNQRGYPDEPAAALFRPLVVDI